MEDCRQILNELNKRYKFSQLLNFYYPKCTASAGVGIP